MKTSSKFENPPSYADLLPVYSSRSLISMVSPPVSENELLLLDSITAEPDNITAVPNIDLSYELPYPILLIVVLVVAAGFACFVILAPFSSSILVRAVFNNFLTSLLTCWAHFICVCRRRQFPWSIKLAKPYLWDLLAYQSSIGVVIGVTAARIHWLGN